MANGDWNPKIERGQEVYSRPQPSAEPVAVWREDFSRLTLQHNLEKIIRDGRDTHPDTLLRRIMDAIPIGAYPYKAAASEAHCEPVAWLYTCDEVGWEIHEDRWGGGTSDDFIGWTETPLYPASALEAARREALEQAAKVADYAQQDWQQQPTRSDNPPGKMLEETFAKGCSETARIIAKAIRALKENPNAE